MNAAAPGLASEDVVAAKRRLRAEAIERRRAWASAEERARAGAAARDRLLAAIPLPPGAAVSAFWSVGEEIDTRPLIEALHARGHPVGLPVVVARGRPLVFRLWRPETALVPAGFGLLQPPPEAPEVVPAVSVTPLLAFDRAGWRLGYGGGFYDRTLALLRSRGGVLAVGYAFAIQEVEAVPRAPYDEPLDWLVTDRFALRLR
ncbi:MAG: 5-formyltetrahydrofolate cyclo-ligase [Rhodospirillaceae bacterium]|nr:5-formyltetrahydrofolate cyclo-ligase [Rhodospirillaceae bacterium]